MKLRVDGHQCHIATGGRKFNPEHETVLFIHGSGQTHLSWVLQSRYCAYDGFNVVAPDLPAHGLSEGAPLETIEDMASWVLALMAALDIQKTHLVGHSQGGLIALEAASHQPDSFDKLVFIATALAIPVNDFLISAAHDKPQAAIEMMTGWGHGQKAHLYDNSQPGFSHLGFGRSVMASHSHLALHADLVACNHYQNGAAAAASLSHKALVILAGADKMTPLKMGVALANTLASAQHVIVEGAGHMLPSEYPDDVNAHMMRFLIS